MKKLFLICFFTVISAGLKAHTETPQSFRKTIFLEAFGQGLQASLNYEMRLKEGAGDGFGFRVGIGGIFTGSSNADAGPRVDGVVAFPLGINYLLGKNHNAFEVGGGFMPLYASTDLLSPTRPKIMESNGWGTSEFLHAGYRYQPINSGFMFRVTWTPLMGAPGFISRFGISAGYSFQ